MKRRTARDTLLLLPSAMLCMLMLCLMSSALPAAAQKIADLDVLNKPNSILLDDSQVYITEGASVYIFSRDTLKLLKHFGKRGEGPQEFITLIDVGITLDVSTPKLMINSRGKLSFYTKSGSFISEHKTREFLLYCLPFGGGYIGWGKPLKGNIRYRAINIYDKNLTKSKEILTVRDSVQLGQKGTRILNEVFIFRVAGNKFFTATGSDFTIHVRGGGGKTIHTISHDYKPLEISAEFKKQVTHFFKTDPAYKNFFPMLQPIILPEFFPAIRNFFVNGEKVYVVTWKRKKEKTEMMVFDTGGKLLRETRVLLHRENPVKIAPYTITEGKVFQLVENEDTETWELHRHEI